MHRSNGVKMFLKKNEAKEKLEIIFGHISDKYIDFKNSHLKNAAVIFPNDEMLTSSMRERIDLTTKYKDAFPTKILVEKKIKDECSKNDFKYYTERQLQILMTRYKIQIEKYKIDKNNDDTEIMETSAMLDDASKCQELRKVYGQYTFEEIVSMRIIYFQLWDCLRFKEKSDPYQWKHCYESPERMLNELSQAQIIGGALAIFQDVKAAERYDFLVESPALVKGGR
jgi:hypothetical protein